MRICCSVLWNRSTTLLTLRSETCYPVPKPWARGAQDVMRKLLQRDPAERLGFDSGAEEIKAHPFFADIQWALIRNTKPPYLPARTGGAARINTAFDSF